MHRFFVPDDAFDGDAGVRLPPDVSHRIRRVLRLRPGDVVALLDGTGREHTVRIDSLGRAGGRGKVLATNIPDTEPATRVTVCMAIVKAERVEIALEKCTELGAARFVPLITEHVQGGAAAAPSEVRLARWRRIAREAAEQSGRAVAPEVSAAAPLVDAVRTTAAEGPVLLFYEGEGGPAPGPAIGTLRPAALALVVGPAGGFTPAEIDAAVGAGARLAGLGRRVLRAETAAIAAVAAVMAHLGELGEPARQL